MKIISFLGFLALFSAVEERPNALKQPEDPAVLKQRLLQVQTQLQRLDKQMESVKKRRKGLLVDLQTITLQRDRARTQMEGARAQRDQTQGQVARLSKETERINKDLKKVQMELRTQVRWLHLLGPWGEWALLMDQREQEAFVSQGRYLRHLTQVGQKRLQKVQELKGDLHNRKKALERSLAQLLEEERKAEEAQAGLRLQEERLQNFLDNLAKDEEAKRKLQLELTEESIQLEHLMKSLLAKPKSSFESPRSFAASRGELPLPVEGRLLQAQGEKIHPQFKTRTAQSGLIISAEKGAPVKAVADGRVVFADYYQSYGPMVILDHGEGYFSIYSRLLDVSVTKGQILRQGEALGAVGEGLEGPRMGFEIRKNAQPEDVQKWLKQKYK